jgi:cytoskeletal protein CcmA (bactofilin family)
VSLKPTAQVKADISAPTISMDMGAQIEGQITMPPQRNML